MGLSGESGGTGCNLTLSSWGGCSSLSLSGNSGLGLWRVYLREPLQTRGRALGRALGRQPGTGPTRAGQSVSVEHVAESVNKGGGWQARAGGAVVPRAGGCPALQPCLRPPRHLTLPLWADFLEGCQGRERSPRLICASTATAEAEARHLETNTFPAPGTLSLACKIVCVCVCVCV